MKIKVISEGREDVWVPEKESLKAFIRQKGFKQIHNFMAGDGRGALIGADHEATSVLEDIDAAERVAILTGEPQKQNMNHALSLIICNELHMYDIGAISADNLDIAR